jgi:O-antigen ligase
MTRPDRLNLDLALLLAALLACCVPTLLAYQRLPSASALAQCLAVALWGIVAAMSFKSILEPRKFFLEVAPLIGALMILAIAALSSWGFGSLPLSLALQAIGILAGAMVMVISGAGATRSPDGPAMFGALAIALLAAGLASCAVAMIQVYAPGWTDDKWIAGAANGVATGNMRQPNHLSFVMLLAIVAAVALHELRLLTRIGLWAAALPLVWVIELTRSRNGALCLLIFLFWSLLDKGISKVVRLLLAATPVIYASAFGATELAKKIIPPMSSGGDLPATFALTIGEVDSRLTIWRNTVDMIAAQPWTGIGFGEFNIAWTLSPFPIRGNQYFDNCHNLFLQLAVELGIPGAAAVILLLMVALWQAIQRARLANGDRGLVARCGLIYVLLAGAYSMVEYPLWYPYFIFPVAMMWGITLGIPSIITEEISTQQQSTFAVKSLAAFWGITTGLLMSLAGAWSLLDYHLVSSIYRLSPQSSELAARIQQGQTSILFAHQADYTAANTPGVSKSNVELGFSRATHMVLDSRMLLAWAKYLVTLGKEDQARWLLQRMREFRTTEVIGYFQSCNNSANSLFQCEVPLTTHSWREFASPAVNSANIQTAPAKAATAAAAASS